ncbi:MAG: bifunctional phosphopantothenoylcysteine decarboxylase/phosphopantothenate--cysteine ligase CoaBC, partial [Ignavibacteriales bacterium]|nr:bifunctional phosphopantothenoylcysteine decarboxylase/phosphopantothenate--cysteine ligase CoaBC [Ignavibacteriales bacterium]
GGIAAYKCNQLIRDYMKLGAKVRVVVTPSALRFVSELTLAALSKFHVISDTFDPANDGTWHITYAQWADIIVIAPVTVNTVAKIAAGFADNALTTLILAKRSPVLVCPAADEDMYDNPVTRRNITTLSENGFTILEAEKGELASGLFGAGRLPELVKIVDATITVLEGYKKDLTGKNILVTAGPTYEDIDPVRYIGNRSSGKMGYALAKAAVLRGAHVTIISGPTSQLAYQEINRINVRSADEMFTEVHLRKEKFDILIMAAAVADYKPEVVYSDKLKKSNSITSIMLKENPDILKSLKECDIFKVGFALETTNEELNALQKLHLKNLDMIVLNSLRTENAGFEHDTNMVSVYSKDGNKTDFPLSSKFLIAHRILSAVISQYGK